MKTLLLDTGFWYALSDHRDQYHSQATALGNVIDRHAIVLPWPVLYETMRSRLMKNAPALERLEIRLGRPNVTRLDDRPYRDASVAVSFDSARRGRPLSLVDCVLRLILQDENVRLAGLATFNPRDFVDICRSRRVEMVPSPSVGLRSR